MKTIIALSILFFSIVEPIIAQGSLSVVAVSPTGAVFSIDQVDAISITFTEPMVPLSSVSKETSIGFMNFTPAIRGKYRWQGTSTLTFIPEKRLQYSTAYSVTIPAGVTSLAGKKLAEQFDWRFVTPTPALVRTEPYHEQTFVELDHSIQLQFNQSIDPYSAAKYLSVEVITRGISVYPKFQTLWNGRGDTNIVHIKTTTPFPQQSLVIVRVKQGLRGKEGNLALSNELKFQFTTINAFGFAGLPGGEFITPGQALRLKFTNPVFERELFKYLRFEPEVTIEEREYYSDYANDEWYLNLDVRPGVTYTGTILPGLKDRFDQELKDTIRFTFSTNEYYPYFSMPTGIGLLESFEARRLPVTTVNIDKFELRMGKIDVEKIIAVRKNFASYGEYHTEANATTNDLKRFAEYFTFSRTIVPKVKRNTIGYYYITLDTMLGAAKSGVVLVETGEKNSLYRTLVNVSNIGVTAKFSPDDILIWATALKNASPIPNADVEIRSDENTVLWRGKTTKDGTVKAPGWGKLGIKTERTSDVYDGEDYYRFEKPVLWVFVRTPQDFAYANSDDGSGIDPWSFNINYEWRPAFEKVTGSLFSDRGLYKAGEKVDLKGIVRSIKDGKWKLISGDSVRITVKNPRDEEIFSKTFTLSAFGSVNASFTLPGNAPLGFYSTLLELKEKKDGAVKWLNIAAGDFRAEAFRPAEFDVTAVMERKSYIVGDSVLGMISAKFLFGAPLKNADVRWRLTVTGGEYQPEGFDGYYFSQIGWLNNYDRSTYRELQNDETVLDEFGNLAVGAVLNVGEIRSTSSLMLEADATSPSRQVISGRTSVTVHNGEFYLGIGQPSTFVKKDSAMKFKMIAVTPEGKFVPNVPVSFRIYNRYWQSVRRAQVGGRYYWESRVENGLVDSGTVISGTQAAEYSFVPKEPGFYFTEASATDPRGNEISSNSYFYVTGSGYVAWERSNDDRIELITDKLNYAPGDVARIIVKNPYETADALVSVEREGIMSHFTVKVKGSAPQIDIPIKKEYLPNVYVSVVLLQGRVDSIASTKESDIGRPSFKIGYTKLSVSPLEKKLSVKLETSKKDYRPGDTVEVSIATMLSTGKPVPSEVTLSVADLGVLNLIGYRLPELFDLFYAQRGLGVSTTETRAHLIEQRNFGEKAEELGGGGAEKLAAQTDADGVRKDFRPSAYWNPSIITDAKGKAKVRFRLPDNITAFQLMAVGHTAESEFGFGENSITVSKPLLLQPSFPRFVRVGDSFEGGVVALNYSDKEKRIKIVPHVEGVLTNDRDTIIAVLKPGESREIRLKYQAVKIGTAKFVFRAYTDDDYDGMQWTIPILVPRLRETAASSNTLTERSIREKIIKPTETYEDLGSLDLSVSSTQLVGLQNSVQYLFEYPYGCLEQKMSRALPIIIGADMVTSFNLDVLKGKDHRKVVQDLLDEVPLYQQYNGGFTYWKNSYDEYPNPYLSGFAMLGLTMAQKNNYRVDKRLMDQGMEFMRGVLNGSITNRYSWGVNSGSKALMLYVLALNGKPDYGYMEQLFNERQKMPLSARAYLLRALKRSNGNSAMINTLASEFMNHVKMNPTTAHFEEQTEYDWWWMFHSNVKSTALIVQALVETQPTNEIIPKAVRWLMDQRRNGIWRSTQENLYVIDALASYFSVYEKEVPKFTAVLSLAGQQLLKEAFEGRTLNVASSSTPFISIPGGSVPLDIVKDGQGRMYYTMRLNYFLKGMSEAKDEGFSVTKTIEHLKIGTDSSLSIGIGKIARVTLTVSTKQDRPFVVIDDPIPAGFEIINTSFQTSGSNLESEEGRNWVINHKEFKDDRALFFADYMNAGVHTISYLVRVTSFGTYHMPSTKAEQMYEPEVFGQTASEVITIE